MSNTYTILFDNNTNLRFIIDSWKIVNESSILQSTIINPKEKHIFNSNVDEWYLHSMFENPKDVQIWKEKGLGDCINIGKFSSMPSVNNKYSWLDRTDKFECIYSQIYHCENNIQKIMTFSQI